MIKNVFAWIFSPSVKPIVEDIDIYSKLIELDERYNALLLDVKRLEEENIETSNVLHELMNSIEAVDRRIDIVAEHYRGNLDV